jgi:hypothetical protein
MKKLLLEFFRPLDTFIFSCLVKLGFIKCIDPMTAFAVGGNILGGIFGARSARKAARQRQRAIQAAFGAFRDPSEILGEAYGKDGIYGDDTMFGILGAESKFIPEFQKLQELRGLGAADIISTIRDQTKLDQLGFLGQNSQQIRDVLEDPRLRNIADKKMELAESAYDTAMSPLSPDAARDATQAALASSGGRAGDAASLANAAMNRSAQKQKQKSFALDAFTSAGQSAQAAAVDPYQFQYGMPSVEQQMMQSFLGGSLAPQVTDPGYAYNLGAAADQRKADMILAKGMAGAQGTAASGQIIGNAIAGAAQSFGNMFQPSTPSFGSFGSMGNTNVLGSLANNNNYGFSIGAMRQGGFNAGGFGGGGFGMGGYTN